MMQIYEDLDFVLRIQRCLDDAFPSGHQLPNFNDLQTLRIQQLAPLRLRSFHARMQAHHLDVQ